MCLIDTISLCFPSFCLVCNFTLYVTSRPALSLDKTIMTEPSCIFFLVDKYVYVTVCALYTSVLNCSSPTCSSTDLYTLYAHG